MPSYDYTPIDVANSGDVRPFAINDSGEIVGFYVDALGNQHGFSYENGVTTTIDVPGSASVTARDVNASGEIVGNTYSPTIGEQGFTDIGGVLQAIVIPDSVDLSAASVNDSGYVTGTYTDTATEKQRAFDYKDGQYETIDISGADSTEGIAINNEQEILLYSTFTDKNTNITSGEYFLYNQDFYTPIAVPGARAGTTQVGGLNDSGEVTGSVNDGDSHYGFVRNDGTYTTFNILGATYLYTAGIDDAGVVTGSYEDAASKFHGFVEKDGVVTVLDSPEIPQAGPSAINDAGTFVGTTETNQIITAFIATLTPPAIAGTAAGQQTTDRDPVAPFAGATLTDPNGTSETLTISLSGGGGTLSGAGLTADADGTYTLAGSDSAVTRQLEALQFTPSGTGAPGSSSTTRFTLTDSSDAGTTASDSTTTVVDTISASTTPSPPPNPSPPPAPGGTPAPSPSPTGGQTPAPTPTPSPSPSPTANPTPGPAASDAVSLSAQVSYRDGVFTLAGTASSSAGVKGVEITATVDGTATDLGAATLNGDGTFSFADAVGRSSQGFITATLTDGAGGTAAGTANYALEGGLRGAFQAEQDRYGADGSTLTATDRFKAGGAQKAALFAPGGETFTSAAFDTFDDAGAPFSTFVFDPGAGRETIAGFRAGGADHDTLSLEGSDFGNAIAEVLDDARNVKGGVLITDPAASSAGPGGQDTFLLKGVRKQDLVSNQNDIAFHT